MKNFLKGLGLFFVVLTMSMIISSKAQATSQTLTLVDSSQGAGAGVPDTWTLTVETGCTTCAVELKVVFGTSSGYAGKYLSNIQWNLTDPNVTPTTIGFTTFTASTPTNTGSWSFSFNNLNANACGPGGPNDVCGQFTGGSDSGTNLQATAKGFGAIVAGSTLTWDFNSIFASQLGTLNTGNIRAAYNNSDASNFNIFSPGGGDFGPGPGPGPGPGQEVPEPMSMVLLGFGLIVMTVVSKRIRTGSK